MLKITEVMAVLQQKETLSEGLYFTIYNAKPSELSWELFDALLQNPYEKSTNYWCASTVAMKLLMPKYKRLCSKVAERLRFDKYEDDLYDDMLLEVQTRIPTYQPDKGKFAIYISPYLEHIAYTFYQDTSSYNIKVHDNRLYSRDAMLENNQYIEDDKDDVSFDNLMIKNDRKAIFDKICTICGIDIDNEQILTDLEHNTTVTENYVAAMKFLGNVESASKIMLLDTAYQIYKEDPDQDQEIAK